MDLHVNRRSVFDGFSLAELGMLFTRDHCESLFVYDFEWGRALPASPRHIAWPGAFCYHKKHKLISKGSPSTFGLTVAITITRQILYWTWYFRNEPDRERTRAIKKKLVAEFTRVAPPELDAWCADLQRAVLQRLGTVLRSATNGGHRWWCNTPGLIKFAYNILLRMGLFL